MNGNPGASHRSLYRSVWSPVIASLLLTACSVLASTPPGNAPPPEAGDASAPGTVDLDLSVSPPDGTPADAHIVLVLLDEVSGLPFNQQEIAMEPQPNGRWLVTVNRPLNSVLHYKYAIRGSDNADEVTSQGKAIRYRTLWLPSPVAIEDIVAAWAGSMYPGSTGRIVGTVVDADTGKPLQEVVVSAAGVSAFTDGQGEFRLEGLVPGLHTLTAFSPDSSTVPFQQGAVVAADSGTPVLLALHPAATVQISFEVEVPADSPSGMPLRMAGNLRQFGDRFADLPGQDGGAISNMATLVQVDASHYILITDLFSGTDFRYKYTLGDGLWNAERDPQGFLTTRQLIVPDADTVIHDVVASWSTPGMGPVTFNAHLPASGSGTLPLGLQFEPSEGFQPLPMSQNGEGSWFYVLYGPLDVQGSLTYRYCRVADCSRVESGGSGEATTQPRVVTPSADAAEVNDDLASWAWQAGPSPLPDIPAAEIVPRPEFEAGIELQPDPDPNSIAFMDATLNEIADGGADAVTLTPTWRLNLPNQLPLMAFDPADAPFVSELETEMAIAQRVGLKVALRPTLSAPGNDLDQWWQDSARDSAWWNAWFEGYRSFLLTYARIGADGGADKLIIGGSELAPAFPRGALQDGALAGVPPDAEKRWRETLDDVRAVFPGIIALELELADDLQQPPPFVDAVDQIQIYWHPALSASGDSSIDDYRTEAGRRMDQTLIADPRLADKPFILSVGYPSVEGGISGCVSDPGGDCYNPSAFAMGAIPEPALRLDLDSQALAYDAVLTEAYSRPRFSGLYARGYNPSASLQDLSTSVRGKPAQVVLWYWFSRISGKVAP